MSNTAVHASFFESTRDASLSVNKQYVLQGNSTPVSNSNFEVRLALPHELDEVFALRYDIFLAAHQQQQNTMRDVDEYDALADHLIVKHDGRIVATYRIMPTDRVISAGLSLYASHEFDVSALMEQLDPRCTVELGRSCVHPAYRQGSIPKLLWSALAKYMMEHGRTEAVGCVSVFNCSGSEAHALVDYFKTQESWSKGVECASLMPANSGQQNYSDAHLKSIVPPLLRSYLMLGAKILGGPAHDPVFHCHDFLIHFSTVSMSDRCRRAFFTDSCV